MFDQSKDHILKCQYLEKPHLLNIELKKRQAMDAWKLAADIRQTEIRNQNIFAETRVNKDISLLMRSELGTQNC